MAGATLHHDNPRMLGAHLDHDSGSAPKRASRRRLVALAVIVVAFPTTALPETFPPAVIPTDQDIVVHVSTAGNEVLVNVDCPVQAPISVVWSVLTDYDHMAKFVSNLESSAVERSTGNTLTVRQTGKVRRGLFTFSFDTVRDIELVPPSEIRSRLVSGEFKASVFTTRIVESDGVVHVLNSGRYTPNMWVPPLLGPALIEGETRRQYGEIRNEIVRRAARAAAATRSRANISLDDHDNETGIRQ